MLIKLKVHPDSKQSSIVKKADDAYEVWVKSPAERGLANTAALQALAKALNQNVARLHIIKGATSPNKIVKVLGRKTKFVEKQLGPNPTARVPP